MCSSSKELPLTYTTFDQELKSQALASTRHPAAAVRDCHPGDRHTQTSSETPLKVGLHPQSKPMILRCKDVRFSFLQGDFGAVNHIRAETLCVDS